MADLYKQSDSSTSGAAYANYKSRTSPYESYLPGPLELHPNSSKERTDIMTPQDQVIPQVVNSKSLKAGEEISSPRQFSDISRLHLEANSTVDGEGRTLNLRELSHNELKDPKMREFLKLSESLSLGPFFIATEEENEDLTGTIIEDEDITYRLQRLVSRGNDSDIYAVAVRMVNSRWLQIDSFHACAYTFQGVPKALSEYRRRSMRRLIRHNSCIGPFHQNGKNLLLCPVDIDSNASNPVLKDVNMGRENARIKQQKRRQRKRAQKRENLFTSDEIDVKANSDGSQKRNKPSPQERSLKFLLGLYDFDNPQIDANTATDEDWEAVLHLSKSIHRAKDDQIINRKFESIGDLDNFVKERHSELLFLTKQQKQLPKIEEMLLSRCKDATGLMKKPHTEISKFRYASRLLPRLIEALKVCHRKLADRFELAMRNDKEWTTLRERLRIWNSLSHDKSRLSYDLAVLVRGSPAWNKASTELGIVQMKMREMGGAPVSSDGYYRAWINRRKALDPQDISLSSDFSDGE